MGNYFKVQQSITSHGFHKWYWSLHQPSGHMYHISQGFYSIQDCFRDLELNGETWMEQLQ